MGSAPHLSAATSSNSQKYQANNPIVQYLLNRFLNRVVRWVEQLSPESILDLGCGEGWVAERILEGRSVRYEGFDINPQAVAHARTRVPKGAFATSDLWELERAQGSSDLVLSLEVLEHLDDPKRAIQRYASWARSDVLVSVPWEPFFRTGNLVRGKYLNTFGNHPEHIQQFGPRSLRALMKDYFQEVTVVPCFPWLIAHGRTPVR